VNSRASFGFERSLPSLQLGDRGLRPVRPPEQDPVQIKLNDLDTRLARIERVVTNQSLLDLANQGDSLAQRFARHAATIVDVLANNLEASRKQQRDLYADLDSAYEDSRVARRRRARGFGGRIGRRGPWRHRWGFPGAGFPTTRPRIKPPSTY